MTKTSPLAPQTFSQRVLTLQIIAGAMLTAVAAFAVYTLVLEKKVNEQPLISYVALGLACPAIIAAMIMPGIAARSAISQLDLSRNAEPPKSPQEFPDQLVTIYQTSMIIGFAILEGAAMFCILAYLIEGMGWTIVAAGVLWLFMLFRFPLPSRVEDWCRLQLENASLRNQV